MPAEGGVTGPGGVVAVPFVVKAIRDLTDRGPAPFSFAGSSRFKTRRWFARAAAAAEGTRVGGGPHNLEQARRFGVETALGLLSRSGTIGAERPEGGFWLVSPEESADIGVPPITVTAALRQIFPDLPPGFSFQGTPPQSPPPPTTTRTPTGPQSAGTSAGVDDFLWSVYRGVERGLQLQQLTRMLMSLWRRPKPPTIRIQFPRVSFPQTPAPTGGAGGSPVPYTFTGSSFGPESIGGWMDVIGRGIDLGRQWFGDPTPGAQIPGTGTTIMWPDILKPTSEVQAAVCGTQLTQSHRLTPSGRSRPQAHVSCGADGRLSWFVPARPKGWTVFNVGGAAVGRARRRCCTTRSSCGGRRRRRR